MSDLPPAWREEPLTPAETLANLFKTGDGANFTIKCEGRNWRLHKPIMRQHGVFAAACKPIWKEGDKSVFTFTEETKEAVEAFLQFIYTAEYDAKISKDYKLHLLAYQIGHKYMEGGLVKLARRKFVKQVEAWSDDQDPKTFPEAAKHLYENSPLREDFELRKAVVAALFKRQDTFIGSEGINEVICNIPGLQLDLIILGQSANGRSLTAPLPELSM